MLRCRKQHHNFTQLFCPPPCICLTGSFPMSIAQVNKSSCSACISSTSFISPLTDTDGVAIIKCLTCLLSSPSQASRAHRLATKYDPRRKCSNGHSWRLVADGSATASRRAWAAVVSQPLWPQLQGVYAVNSVHAILKFLWLRVDGCARRVFAFPTQSCYCVIVSRSCPVYNF